MGSGSSRRGDAEVLPPLQPPQPGAQRAPRYPTPPQPPSSIRVPLTREDSVDSGRADSPWSAPPQTLTELQEIQDLEKTFDSLGIPLKVDKNANVSEDARGEERAAYESNETQSDEATKCEVRVLLESVPDTPVKKSSPSTDSTRSAREVKSPEQTVQSNISIKINGVDSSSPEKNMQSSTIESKEDWTYSQKEIEGFDMEKFRRANRKMITADEKFALPIIRNNIATTTLHPLHFPTYDSTDEQILAGIEEEFGS